MQIIIITIITFVLTFSLNPVFKKVNKKINQKRSSKHHVHHSVLGVLLLAVGVIIGNEVVAAIGLGIYLAHGIEEIYFNKRNVIAAFFIFVTR
jgi:UDP-N-acetylmuramyl pentapeptide phosphotransferase/UDP-N-acetylglucosamine-1-phosphate transferase